MLDQPATETLQEQPLLIELETGESIVCLEGTIWATATCTGGKRDACAAPTDEFLYPGDQLISRRSQSFCISSLHRQPSRFAVFKASGCMRGACRRAEAGGGACGYVLTHRPGVLQMGVFA
jgi:hypothetical protein